MMDNESAEDHEKSTLVRVGDMAPDFTVELLSGNKATLSQMQGNTVLLVFFESTCPDCKLQLSLLNGVLEQFADKN
ncbi:MAG: redoxin domain-containing protein, partial [Alistipes sp.]|nr:redoxin domain-containing protein [Alistipes sp.]